MALTTVRDDLTPPPFFITFDDPSADVVLHADSLNGGSAPDGITHLPCSIFVRAEAGEVLHITDVAGNETSITFVAAFYDSIRCAPAILNSETDCSVTVFWNPEP